MNSYPSFGSSRIEKIISAIPEKRNVFVLSQKQHHCYSDETELISKNYCDTVKVSSIGSVSPRRLLHFLKLDGVFNYLSFPDKSIFWVPTALLKAWKIISDENISSVFSSSPPVSIHLIGFLIKSIKKNTIFWIADFRDLWTLNSFKRRFNPPTNFHMKIARLFESMIYKKCDIIISNTPSMKDLIVMEFDIDPTKIVIMTNGYVGYNSIEEMNDKKNQIDAGKQKDIYYLGPLVKEGQPWEKALRIFKELFTTFNSLKLISFGGIPRNSEKLKNEFPFLIFSEQMPHESLINMAKAEANYILVILADLSSTRACVPQKLYDSISLQKPIIYLGPLEGDAFEIMSKSKAGICLNISDPINIIVKKILDYFENPKFHPNHDEIKKYLVDNIVGKFNCDITLHNY